MAERPIIFSGPMVNAILAGRKSQTRRMIKPRGRCSLFDGSWTDDNVLDPGNAEWRAQEVTYAVGDRLWVREAWRTESRAYDDLAPSDMDADYPVIYEADAEWKHNKSVGRLRAAIHMPRWASRLTLTVTDVRVQRLQDISAEDSIAEGVECDTCRAMDHSACNRRGCFASLAEYRALWTSLHGPGSWDANPWVTAITFTAERRNIDGGGDAV